MMPSPSGSNPSPSAPRRPGLQTQVLIGAAGAAALITGVAYLLLRQPAPEPAKLLAALDAFTGEWQGEGSIELSGGQSPIPLRVTRQYSWVGQKQIVVTLFVHGDEVYENRAIQWIEDGMLKAIVTGGDAAPTTFSGTPRADGILWTNQDHPKADHLDRVVIRNDQPAIHSASFAPIRLGAISGERWIAAILQPEMASPSSPADDTPVNRQVTELENQLASVAAEREALRAKLAQTETVARAAEPIAPGSLAAGSPASEAPSTASWLEIKSAQPGVSFDIRAAGGDAEARGFGGASGTTPAALMALSPGEYVITLRRPGTPDQTYNISMRPNMDVRVLYRREDPPLAPARVAGDHHVSFQHESSLPPGDHLVRSTDIDEPPIPIIAVLPLVRGQAERRGQIVSVSMLVDEHGVPHDASVAGNVEDPLRRTCLDAAAQWRFRPAQAGGRPAGIRVMIPFVLR